MGKGRWWYAGGEEAGCKVMMEWVVGRAVTTGRRVR
jgi:hypothetical protein